MKRLIPLTLISLLLLLSLVGCQNSEDEAVTACIDTELSLLKSDDRGEISSAFTGSEFLEELGEDTLPSEIIEVLQLFYQDFEYAIKDITIEEDNLHAQAWLNLKTLDAKSLAKDFTAASITKQLQNQAAPSAVEYSLEDYYLSLHDLLTDNNYEILESEYTVTLSRSREEDSWQMDSDPDLDNALTGNFITYAADPDLFTPEEIVALHFDTIKDFDTEQLNRFLSLTDLFETDDEHKQTIAKAMTSQILDHLDYEILDSENDGIHATVTVNVTTCDWNHITIQYRDQVTEYTATSQALADGFSGRLSRAYEIFSECITSNTASATSQVTLDLVNDGTNWKLQSNDAFSKALLGDVEKAIENISSDSE